MQVGWKREKDMSSDKGKSFWKVESLLESYLWQTQKSSKEKKSMRLFFLFLLPIDDQVDSKTMNLEDR